MSGKIALEEHFITPDLVDKVTGGLPDPAVWKQARRRLLDMTDLRLADMDDAGIDYSLLSVTGPAVQGETDPQAAVHMAREKNDFLAESIAPHRGRLGGLAAVALQDPAAAAAELERAVTTLGFSGALINGFTDTADPNRALYLDRPEVDVFWSAVERLDVPVYLHPRDPLQTQREAYRDHEVLLGSAWAFGVETATHALRLITGGVFDRHPGVQIVLGHLGETLPYSIWRVQHRYEVTHRGVELARPLAEYLTTNFHATTSGFFDDAALRFTIEKMGHERVMFSSDYPYEDMIAASEWFDRAPLTEQEHRAVSHSNAEKLFKIHNQW
ncbi:amidohydrolase family protein [Rhodococcus sp. NPDC059968]|uniref:amidohydrolase family protein n=1 Tax=Rhodococcus sp. NPDC059968 TaxID=3347017 RepID=UPI00366C7BBD